MKLPWLKAGGRSRALLETTTPSPTTQVCLYPAAPEDTSCYRLTPQPPLGHGSNEARMALRSGIACGWVSLRRTGSEAHRPHESPNRVSLCLPSVGPF